MDACREDAGGDLNGGFDAAGVRHEGARGKPRADGTEGFLHLVDRSGYDDDVGSPYGVDGVVEDLRHRISLEEGPGFRGPRPSREGPCQLPASRSEQDRASDEARSDDGDAFKLRHLEG
jgi:hypothetical protein